MERLEILNVSVDRLTLVGGVADRRELVSINTNPFVRGQGRARYPYDYTWYMEDGSVLQLAQAEADVRPLRYDFNPNRWDNPHKKDMHIMSILRLMKNVVPSRIDVAIDVVGEDLGQYEWRDLRARKREVHSDGAGRVETIYIGSERSETRLRIYNKKKERADKGSDIGQEHDHWWRVEAQLRGSDAENYMKINPFRDLAVTKKYQVNENGVILEYDIRVRAMLFYLQHFPEAINELSKDSRAKYKQLLAATKEQVAEESFTVIYEQNKERVREIVDTYINCTLTTFRREEEPDETV